MINSLIGTDGRRSSSRVSARALPWIRESAPNSLDGSAPESTNMAFVRFADEIDGPKPSGVEELSLSPGGIALIPEVPSPMERDSGTGQPPDLLLDALPRSRHASRCDSTRSGHRSRALSRTHPGHSSTPRKPGSPFPEPEETILAAGDVADPVDALVARLNSKLNLRSRQASRTSPGSKRGTRGEGGGSGSSSDEDSDGSGALVLPLGQGRLSSFSRNPRQIPVESQTPIVARKSSRFRKFLGPN